MNCHIYVEEHAIFICKIHIIVLELLAFLKIVTQCFKNDFSICKRHDREQPRMEFQGSRLMNLPDSVEAVVFMSQKILSVMEVFGKVASSHKKSVTTEFNRLPTRLTCLNRLHYMLKPPANVYPAEPKEQCYHVTKFDMEKFSMYGKLTFVAKGLAVYWIT